MGDKVILIYKVVNIAESMTVNLIFGGDIGTGKGVGKDIFSSWFNKVGGKKIT